MKRLLLSIFVVLNAGCATCQQHPVWCAVGTAVIVGSVAAAVEHNHDQQHEFACGPNQANRSNGVIGSCVGQ